MFFKPECTKLPWTVPFSRLRKFNDNCPLIFRDTMYRVPTDPTYIIKKLKVHKYKYLNPGRQCEDFNYIFKGALARKGYGDLLVVDTSLTVPGYKPHAVLGFYITTLDGFIFFDGQTGQRYPLAHGTIFNHFIF